MARYLHFIVSFIFIMLFHFSISAQNVRVNKKSSINNLSIKKESSIEKKVGNVLGEKQHVISDSKSKSIVNIKTSDFTIDSIVSVKKELGLYNKDKVGDNSIENIVTNKINIIAPDDNVTYTKEEFQENEVVTVSEIKPFKVTQSQDFKPHILKEDTPKITDYSTLTITNNKRIYLQQEQEDLELEINQNKHNPDYDLIQNQKKLDYIKTLLK